MEILAVNVKQQRRDLAQEWAETRKTLSYAHREGLYGVAARMRFLLRQIEQMHKALREVA